MYVLFRKERGKRKWFSIYNVMVCDPRVPNLHTHINIPKSNWNSPHSTHTNKQQIKRLHSYASVRLTRLEIRPLVRIFKFRRCDWSSGELEKNLTEFLTVCEWLTIDTLIDRGITLS